MGREREKNDKMQAGKHGLQRRASLYKVSVCGLELGQVTAAEKIKPSRCSYRLLRLGSYRGRFLLFEAITMSNYIITVLKDCFLFPKTTGWGVGAEWGEEEGRAWAVMGQAGRAR